MEISSYQITDLTLTELREVNGGFVWGGLIIVAVVAVIADRDNFNAGIAGKPEIARNKISRTLNFLKWNQKVI